MSEFKSVRPEALSGNFIEAIGHKWALFTATKPDGTFNTMTISWGGIGVLWNKPVCFVFVRPQRYTHEFSEEGECFTLSFFDDTYREKLTYCGRISGRDEDKVAKCGFTPVKQKGYTYFAEAKQVLAVRKLYVDEIKEGGFLDAALSDANYPKKDYHTVYVCEIVGAEEAL